MKQHITRSEIQPASEAFDRDVEYARKAKQHFWIATAVYRTSAQVLLASADGGNPLLMDRENLFEVMAGCFICEEPWRPVLANRSCPGEPK